MNALNISRSMLSSHGLPRSFRFQIFLSLLGGVLLPGILAAGLSARSGYFRDALAYFSTPTTSNSLVFAATATLVFLVALRRMDAYPGVLITQHILPALATTYAIILAVFMLFRLDYSVVILLLTFFGTLITRYSISGLIRRSQTQLILMVPGGRLDIGTRIGEALVHSLSEPRLPKWKNVAVIADLHFDHKPEWERFLADSAISGTPVYHYKHVLEANTGKVQMDHLSENSFGALIPALGYRKVKRFVDLIVSIVALPFLLPFLLVVACMIKRDSRGPALFRQKRMGHHGKVFEVIKFRTMADFHDGEDSDLSVTTVEDERITRIGRFLRRTRIDELPQIINILRGEMSWIGPRPEAISLSLKYEAAIPFYRYRHIVRPGITGWAQVNQGHVTEVGAVIEKLQYDFYYVKNFSHWIDMLIFFRTIKVILTGFGAK